MSDDLKLLKSNSSTLPNVEPPPFILAQVGLPTKTPSILDRRNEYIPPPLSSVTLLDNLTSDLNQAGAVVGLLSIFCSFIRPLRPLSSLGIEVLSHPGVALTLLTSSGYSLYRQSPMIWDAAQRVTSAYPENSPHSLLEDLLHISGFGLGVIGFGVGTHSFILGGRTYFSRINELQSQGVPKLVARQIAWEKADAVRRAVQDPDTWVKLARSDIGYSPLQKLWLAKFGRFTGHALLEGSAIVGVGQLGIGIEKMISQSNRGETVEGKEVWSLLLNSASQVAPGVTVALYRAGRGNSKFLLGPAPAQKLSEAGYRDPENVAWALREFERGIARHPADQEKAFLQKGLQDDLPAVREMLEKARSLEALKRTQSDASPESSFVIPQRIQPKPSSAPSSTPFAMPMDWSLFGIEDFLRLYSEAALKPSEVWKVILEHPEIHNGAIFPRQIDRGWLGFKLNRLVKESDRRFRNGNPRPLEGIFVAVKDNLPGLDGVMNLGSKTARVTGFGKSPVVEILLELGAIPIPVGMVASANGGAGNHAAYGYVPHPFREGFDPGGSSSGTAWAVGNKRLPINLGIGSDIGGSIIDPAGACGLFGFVPPRGLISTNNMVSSAIFLERLGVMAQRPKDGMMLARYLSRSFGDDPHQVYQNPGMLYQPSPQRPTIVYLEEYLAPPPPGREPMFSPESVANFRRQLNLFRHAGFEVIALDARWNFLSEVPYLLYPYDAYAAAVFTYTNAFQRNRFQPPRRTQDENLNARLPKGALSLRSGLFDQARSSSALLEALVTEKLGKGFVIALPSVEAVPTQEVLSGTAGPKWDNHDRVTMLKNRIGAFGQINLPTKNRKGYHVGITFSGALPDLMHVVETPP